VFPSRRWAGNVILRHEWRVAPLVEAAARPTL
jgi:hypothetical protein